MLIFNFPSSKNCLCSCSSTDLEFCFAVLCAGSKRSNKWKERERENNFELKITMKAVCPQMCAFLWHPSQHKPLVQRKYDAVKTVQIPAVQGEHYDTNVKDLTNVQYKMFLFLNSPSQLSQVGWSSTLRIVSNQSSRKPSACLYSNSKNRNNIHPFFAAEREL